MVPATRVAELEGMVSAGVETEARAAFALLTVTMAPEGALVVTLVQMWGTLETSEEPTAPVVSAPRPKVPPEPEKVPSQAVAAACEPTLKEMEGAMAPETVTWSSSTIAT